MALPAATAGLLFKIDGDSSQLQKELKAVDASVGSLTSKMSTLGGAATIAAAGIAAIGTAAVTAGRYLFDLAKASAEYGSAIFDATEKTGLSAEAISSMKIAADRSGTSLENVTLGLARFAKTIGAAADGSEEAQKKLDKLHVTSKDLDTALSQALLTIARYPPGVQQMTAAQAAFGKSGADLLPFIKDFKGDLPELIERCKKLGLTLSGADAKAADEFGDTLDLLKAQAEGVGRAFIGPVMRDITKAMTDISGSLAKNQSSVKEWGEQVDATLRGLKTAALDVYNFSETVPGRALKFLLFGGLIGVNNALQQLGGGVQSAPLGAALPHDIPGNQVLDASGQPINRGGGDFGEQAKDEADKRAKEREAAFQKELSARSKQNALMLAGERASFAANQQAWEQAFLKGEETKERFREVSLHNIETYEKRTQFLIENAYKIDATGKSGTELQNAQIERTNSLAALQREVAKERLDLEKTLGEEQKKNDDAEMKAIEDRENAEKAAAEQYIHYLEEIYEKTQEQQKLVEEFRKPDSVFASPEDFGISDPAIVVNKITPIQQAFKDLKAIGGDAIHALAQGIGSLVQNWVLLGSAGPNAMRKLVASVLAGVAAQAATLAIMELAYGIAALTPWGAAIYGPAVAHFKAAALFGIVAAGAAVAGRGIAGDAFKQQTANGGAGSSGGGGRQGTGGTEGFSSNDNQVVEHGINVLGPRGLVIHDKSGMFSQLFNVEWERNGRMRRTLQDAFAQR